MNVQKQHAGSVLIMLCLACLFRVDAQNSSDCEWAQNIYSGTPDISNVICWEFARVYLEINTTYSGGDQNSHNIPTASQLEDEHDDPNKKDGRFCNDSDFTVTTDPNEADIVVWQPGAFPPNNPADHVAVALGNGLFISKGDGNNGIEEHDLCGANSGRVRIMFKYRNRGRGLGTGALNCPCWDPCFLFTNCSNMTTNYCPPAVYCINSTTGTINYTQTLAGWNSLTYYSNTVRLTSDCSSITWSYLSGDGSWSKNYNGKRLNVYLDQNEYIFLRASYPGQAATVNYMFQRSGSPPLRAREPSLNTSTTGIYPNPFDNYVLLSEEYQESMLHIFDLRGKLIKSVYSSQTKIDLSELKSGIYLLKGTKKNGKSFTEKLVKR